MGKLEDTPKKHSPDEVAYEFIETNIITLEQEKKDNDILLNNEKTSIAKKNNLLYFVTTQRQAMFKLFELLIDFLEQRIPTTKNNEELLKSYEELKKLNMHILKNQKLYGTNAGYSGVTVTLEYSGYTIDGLVYRDYPDGYTHISGVTSGTTETFFQDEIYNGMITRNEHFLGFVDDPQIFSDVFVE